MNFPFGPRPIFRSKMLVLGRGELKKGKTACECVLLKEDVG